MVERHTGRIVALCAMTQKPTLAADPIHMVTTRWTRESLIDFVAGKRLFARDADAGAIPPPEWLGEVAFEVSPLNSVQSLDATHPDDRSGLIEAFITSIEQPGVEVPCQVRIALDGTWNHARAVWINLLDHPDVKGIICASTAVPGPDIVPPTIQFEGSMAATNWMIVALDDTGRVASVRGRIDKILGYSSDEVHGHLLTDFIHPDCMPDAIENWVHLWELPGQTRTSRWVWRRNDGVEVWLESSYLVHDDDLVEVVVVDVNDQVANEEALAESQREVATLAEDFRLLADEVPTAVFRCDRQGRVQFHNTQWIEMFHGEVPRVHDLIDETDRPAFDTLLSGLSKDETSASQSIEVSAAGEARVLEIRCRAVAAGVGAERFVGSISDVTVAANFRHQALHDQLTGLANRAMIEATLADAVKVDPDGTLVVFIDLDGFKAVNDQHGHDVGDAVLAEVGARLSKAVRPGDSVARYGGDEFVIVCRGVSPDGECRIVDRLSSVFGAPIEIDDVSWVPQASLGVARPEPDVDPATVLRRADQAMFEQKRTHKSR